VVVTLLRTDFLFWQRGHTSGDGRDYINMYNINIEQGLPRISFLDPRTGAELLTIIVIYIFIYIYLYIYIYIYIYI
jgi:hypothetical protein